MQKLQLPPVLMPLLLAIMPHSCSPSTFFTGAIPLPHFNVTATVTLQAAVKMNFTCLNATFRVRLPPGDHRDVSLAIPCVLNMPLFPLDSEVCQLNVSRLVDIGWGPRRVTNWLLGNIGGGGVGVGERVGGEWKLDGLTLTGNQSSQLRVLLRRDAAYYVTTVYGPTSAMVLTVWISLPVGIGSVAVQTAVPVLCMAGLCFLWTIVNMVIPHGVGGRALDVWFYLCLGFALIGLLRALAVAAARLTDAAPEGGTGGGSGPGVGGVGDRELLSGSQLARSTETAWARAVRGHVGPAVDAGTRRKRLARRRADAAFFAAYAVGFAMVVVAYWTVYLTKSAEARRRQAGLG